MQINLAAADEDILKRMAKAAHILGITQSPDPLVFLRYCMDCGGGNVVELAKQKGVKIAVAAPAAPAPAPAASPTPPPAGPACFSPNPEFGFCQNVSGETKCLYCEHKPDLFKGANFM
jgi:hypothetical protein